MKRRARHETAEAYLRRRVRALAVLPVGYREHYYAQRTLNSLKTRLAKL